MSIGDHEAFPLFEDGEVLANGLSKRELFAAMAMQGHCASPEMTQVAARSIAIMSVEQADALLTELAKEPT